MLKDFIAQAPLTDSSNYCMKALSYWIVLYPSLEQCVSYGLTSVVLANTFESLVVGGKRQLSRTERSIHRFLLTIVRLIAPIFVSNLVAETKYLSLVLFWLMYFIPGFLQYKSRIRWHNEVQMVIEGASMDMSSVESTPLLSSDTKFVNDTEYSGWYSHPLVVVLVELFALTALILTVVGIALPHSVS